MQNKAEETEQIKTKPKNPTNETIRPNRTRQSTNKCYMFLK